MCCPAIYTNMKYKRVLKLWVDLWPADTSKNTPFFSSKGSCFQSHVSLTYVSILIIEVELLSCDYESLQIKCLDSSE